MSASGAPAWYDPAADPGNFPLELVPPLGVRVHYSTFHDEFTAEVDGQLCCVARHVLAWVYGLAPFRREGILYGAVELAALDYFRHEAFFRRLRPSQEV